MKRLLFIPILAVVASSCAMRKKQPENPGAVIGMSVDAFKSQYPRAGLVHLSTDSATYKVHRGSNADLWIEDFYYFGKGKLAKFKQKTHFFNHSRVTIERVDRDKKN